MKRLVASAYLVALLILGMGGAQAEGDLNQPVTIEADRVDVDEAKGQSVYRGNVVLQQGGMELRADELTIITTAKRELESIQAKGKPARFTQQATAEAGELTGRALEITYKVAEQYMLFVGDAYFWQCGDEFMGNQLEFWRKDGLVKARKAENGTGRVTVTLQPREEGQTAKDCRKKATP